MAQITGIYAAAVRHGTASFEIDPPDLAEMTRRQQTLLGARYPYLVATLAGGVIGYAHAGPYRTRAAYRWTVEDSLYVALDFHHHGIGSRLLSSLVDASEARGFRQMIAVIGDSAQAASIAVHARAGFERIGTLRAVGFKRGRWLDTVMQRPLGAADTAPPS